MDDDDRGATTVGGRGARRRLVAVGAGELVLLVASTLGAVLPGPDGLVAATVTTALYMVAAIAHGAVATLVVVLWTSTGAHRPAPTWTTPALAVGAPAAAAVLLAAAYVSELEGGPFVGGWGAMLALTASLVVVGRRLGRRTEDRSAGRGAGQVAADRTVPVPVPVPVPPTVTAVPLVALAGAPGDDGER